jgi:SAM-dependent methyltransferase
MKIERKFAYPLAVGSDVPLQGRVRECVNLVAPGHRLLDIGCSSGWLAPHVLSKGFQTYVGTDRAIIGSDRAGVGAYFVASSIFALPFDNASFDAACLFDVIEHLPRGTESQALHELRRVLRKGGHLYFSTPHASPVHTPLDPVWVLGHRHYRKATVRRLLLSAGFSVDRLFVAGGVTEGLDHIRLLTYKHLLRRPLPHMDWVTQLIERSHDKERAIGMTVFAVATC